MLLSSFVTMAISVNVGLRLSKNVYRHFEKDQLSAENFEDSSPEPYDPTAACRLLPVTCLAASGKCADPNSAAPRDGIALDLLESLSN
jgi:hypothetical protein